MARGARHTDPEKLPRPFLKWAGGKRQLLPELLARVPQKFGAYHEPFLGGGALFFALKRTGRLDSGIPVFLSDVNSELVETYRAIQCDAEKVIAVLRRHKCSHSEDYYYEVRAKVPRTPHEIAARMIYLNHTGYNGLYRVNSSGLFNVPYGRYRNPTICDEANLRTVAEALSGVTLRCAPFEEALRCVRRGQFVYFDPPYWPLSKTANFVAYAKGGFGQEDQIRLAKEFARLAGKGVKAMLSNSSTDLVKNAYEGFEQRPVLASRQVNSRADRRGPVEELLILTRNLRLEVP